MKFGRLMTFRVRHPYYRSGYCNELLVQPTKDTAALLRRHRCVYNATGGMANVMVELGKNGSPLVPLIGQSTISLTLTNTPSRFQSMTRATTATIHKNDAAAYENINFSFCSTNQIDLTGPFTSSGDEPLDFELRFEAAEHKWLYYLLTNQSEGAASFNIKHSQTSNPIAWTRSDLAVDDPFQQVAGRYPGARFIRFESTTPVPCSEQPIANLSLCYGTSEIIRNLENPSLTRLLPAADGNDKGQGFRRFHVLRYLSDNLN